MKKIKGLSIFILFIIVIQFWRINDLAEEIIDPKKLNDYYINNEVVYIKDRWKFDQLTSYEKIELLGKNKFYVRTGFDEYRTAFLIFDENNELIYYSRDNSGGIYPEDFNRIKMDNKKINFFMAEKAMPLNPNILDRLDAKLVQWFAYVINWLGLD